MNMLKHYLSTGIRALRRDRGYSIVNVLGLAVGLACCLLILVYILDESSYDQFHENSDRIVRLSLETKGSDGEWRGRVPVFYQLADMIGGNLPGVEETIRMAQDRALLSTESDRFMEENILLAEPTFFDVFTVEFLAGNPETAFDNPYSVVLTRSAAARYFGDADPLGRIITRNNEHDFEVTGVVEPMPSRSHFHFDVLMNLESTHDRYSQTMFQSMGAQWIYTYLLMERSVVAENVAASVNQAMARFIPPDLPVEVRISAHALPEIHLRSRFASELEPTGDARYLYIFGAIAVFMLVIASVNFMNLATARASVRAREVGVRKLLGAHRGQLVRQFLMESTGMTFAAFVLTPGLAALALPAFNAVTGKSIAASILLSPEIIASLLGIAVAVGLLAGSYPAFFLSAFRPARVLKGTFEAGRAGIAYRLRQGLVVFQFAISIAVVLATFIVSGQLRFMRNTYPGFDRSQILSVRLPSSIAADDVGTLKDEFASVPGVASASRASHAPPEGLNSWRIRPSGAPADATELVSWIAVDHDYVETLGLEMVAGRDFSEDFPADQESAIVINETMARHYGLDEPVGSRFDFEEGLFPSGTATVVGVVGDFHQTSLHEEIRPVFFFLDEFSRRILLKVDIDRASSVIGDVDAAWSSVISEWPLEFSFLDDEFDALYRTEQRMGNLFEIFSMLAVFVACMGLFGLSAYMAERRTREVGVRKIFGASILRIVSLMSREFLALVVIGYVIAAPLTWLLMQAWLGDFAYHAEFGAGLFVVTATLALAITALTVSFQAIRAAQMNPVDTLRYE